MNVSAACPQCGAIANPNDRFCNTCGNPLQRAGAPAQPGQPAGQPAQAAPPPPVQGSYGQPPPQQQPYAQPQFPHPQQGYPPQQAPTQQAPYSPQAPQQGRPPQRCQLGHEIMPGMSYCAQGHPLALDAMQFANDPNAPPYQPHQPPQAQHPQQALQPPQGYGAPAPGYGGQPGQPGGQPYPSPAQGLGFGAPLPYQPPPQQGYGGPQPGYPQPVFQPAAVPPQQLYAPPPPPQQGFSPDIVPLHGTKQLRGFVVSFQSNPSGDFWPLSTGRTTVGRANAPEPADIPLTDATISSRHAAFNIDLNVVIVEDTNSTNGTYVNEEHIGQNGKRELRDGDRVRFGGYTTMVKILGRLG